MVYHLLSLETAQRLRLKVRVAGENPQCHHRCSRLALRPMRLSARSSICLESVFDGHPYLRRMLLPEEWEGHPLRKDYPTEGYR